MVRFRTPTYLKELRIRLISHTLEMALNQYQLSKIIYRFDYELGGTKILPSTCKSNRLVRFAQLDTLFLKPLILPIPFIAYTARFDFLLLNQLG